MNIIITYKYRLLFFFISFKKKKCNNLSAKSAESINLAVYKCNLYIHTYISVALISRKKIRKAEGSEFSARK